MPGLVTSIDCCIGALNSRAHRSCMYSDEILNKINKISSRNRNLKQTEYSSLHYSWVSYNNMDLRVISNGDI